jgi:hypothetical protein
VPPSYRQASLRGIARIFSAILPAVLLAVLPAILSLLLALLLALLSLLLALLLAVLPAILSLLAPILLGLLLAVPAPVALISGSFATPTAFSPAALFPTAFTALAAVASISPSHAFLLLSIRLHDGVSCTRSRTDVTSCCTHSFWITGAG